MKSIFHIKCNSPEDLRQELLNWLTARAAYAQDNGEHLSRTKKDQLIAFTEARVYREVAAFWQEIIIDTKEGTAPVPYKPSDGSVLDKLRMGESFNEKKGESL